MPDRPKPESPAQNVDCHVCKKSIPRSAAYSSEADEYRFYYCAQGCSDRHKRERQALPDHPEHKQDDPRLTK
jgi:hypothetical protein